MFFPATPNLPTVGDTVCFRHCHDPYTVGMVSPDNTLYHLVGLDEPVRVETLAWYPMVGDRVEVLFYPHLRYLEAKFSDYHARYWLAQPHERAPIERTMAKIKAAMKRAVNYRTGDLLRIDGALVQVAFPGGAEVLPFNCVSVVHRAPTDCPPAAALPPRSSPSPASSARTRPAPARETQPTGDRIFALHQ